MFTSVALIVGISGPAYGGVWVREPGEGWFQGSVGAATSGSVFSGDGVRLSPTDPALFGTAGALFEGARYTGFDLSAYGELGLVRGLEGVVSLPGKVATQRYTWAVGDRGPIRHRNAGLGDIAGGARVGGRVKGVALSLYLGGRAPLYDNAPTVLRTAAGNTDLYDDRVPLGQGTIEGEALGGIGMGTGVLHGWLLVEGGVRVRDRGYSTALPGRAQLGVKTAVVHAWLGANATASLGNGAAPDDFLDPWGKGPTIVDHSSWLSVELGALLPLSDRWSLLASGSQVIAARRWAALTQGSLGVAWSGSLLKKRSS